MVFAGVVVIFREHASFALTTAILISAWFALVLAARFRPNDARLDSVQRAVARSRIAAIRLPAIVLAPCAWGLLLASSDAADQRAPRTMPTYADCEFGYADITVWRQPSPAPLALYEVKAFYPSSQLAPVVRKARAQLEDGPLAVADNRVGLFFAIYTAKGHWQDQALQRRSAKSFRDEVRNAVRGEFKSDHHIRMTPLVAPTTILYGDNPWWTTSWITWGHPQ